LIQHSDQPEIPIAALPGWQASPIISHHSQGIRRAVSAPSLVERICWFCAVFGAFDLKNLNDRKTVINCAGGSVIARFGPA
jgi:hypothetical protein